MNAICAGFKDPPRMCQRLLDDDDLEDDLEVGIIYYDDGFHHWHLIALGLLTTCCVIVGLCFWRRHARREMRTTMQRQIKEAVNHYVALSSTDSEAPQPSL